MKLPMINRNFQQWSNFKVKITQINLDLEKKNEGFLEFYILSDILNHNSTKGSDLILKLNLSQILKTFSSERGEWHRAPSVRKWSTYSNTKQKINYLGTFKK